MMTGAELSAEADADADDEDEDDTETLRRRATCLRCSFSPAEEPLRPRSASVDEENRAVRSRESRFILPSLFFLFSSDDVEGAEE
jgi:hypothetical protein